MVKKLLVACMLFLIISSCFAGYSRGGGRSGFSGGSRSFGSSRSYSSGRSGFSRSTNTIRSYARPRAYIAPRSYSGRSHTVINNHHYSNGGYGGGMGGFGHGLMGGMIGGYIGSSLFGNHGTTVIAGGGGGQPYIGDGQGAMIDGDYPVVQSQSSFAGVILIWLFIAAVLLVILVKVLTRDDCDHRSNRW